MMFYMFLFEHMHDIYKGILVGLNIGKLSHTIHG